MVTKKDFKAIAEIIKNQHQQTYGNFPIADNAFNIAKTSISQELTDYFAIQNPHFDRQKFLDTCGLK